MDLGIRIGEGVVAVDVDGVKFGVGGVEATGGAATGCGESLQVLVVGGGPVDLAGGVHIGVGFEATPDDETGFAVGVLALDGEKGVGFVLGALNTDLADGHAEQVVEGLDEIDDAGLALAGVGIVDLGRGARRRAGRRRGSLRALGRRGRAGPGHGRSLC